MQALPAIQDMHTPLDIVVSSMVARLVFLHCMSLFCYDLLIILDFNVLFLPVPKVLIMLRDLKEWKVNRLKGVEQG